MIGHTHLTHSHLLSKEPPPTCTYCFTLLTVEHILTNCSHYQSIRQKYYQYSDLSNVFQVIPPKSPILFIKAEVGKVRPAGQIRPASSVHPAHGGSSVLTLNSARKSYRMMSDCFHAERDLAAYYSMLIGSYTVSLTR